MKMRIFKYINMPFYTKKSASVYKCALVESSSHGTLTIITINLRDIFTAPCIMILRRENHITRVIVFVVLKVEPVLGPGIARA